MNQNYLSSYSDSEGSLIVRDFEKGQPIVVLSNFKDLLGL